jgi:hypothetical protein
MPDETNQLATLEEVSRQRLAGWWDAMGEEPHYPCDSATVCRLLQRVDYAVDHDWLLHAIEHKMIPPPPRVAGRLAWDATHIVALAAAAEARRRWVPGSTIHFHKLSLAEKIVQCCREHGGEPFSDLHEFDLEGLLGVLHQIAGDAGAVQCIAEAIREKLKRQGVL